jgi:hypothetical protein
MARLGWALHGSTVALTVPIGEFTGTDVGSVVVWITTRPPNCSKAGVDQPVHLRRFSATDHNAA